MPPSTCRQSVKGKTITSGANGKNTEDEKTKRYEKLTADIDAIWKEVKKDVEGFSNPPSDQEAKKWKAGRVFDKWQAGKNGQNLGRSEKDDESTRKIVDPTPKILEIMENVTPGKTVAGGVSQAFAPAPLCFEAISFFLQFWLNNIEMQEMLEELLSKYVIELRYITAKLIGSLVRVLRFSVDIGKSNRGILGRLVKHSFLGDNEIGKLFSEMSSLVEEEHRVLATLMYRGVRNIQQVMTQQQIASDAKAWRIAISKALGFTDEPKQLWMDRLQDIRLSLIPDTGHWATKT
ncbi:hypothetical protein COCVIDRAFT_31932 [Bipolaris victoriae FI3]|uniref:Fungal STAND N-terminal Goodbye domain-containing protein n=1 Tax=Bipolaris victoriae (strain FI3) TaxID=930091 RepID=W7E9G3_BIPV3|nr:hypothetical protein COCVIDRAFT_31932 [Bipolaris victoriae FI3]